MEPTTALGVESETYADYLNKCYEIHVSPFDVVIWLQIKNVGLQQDVRELAKRVAALEAKNDQESGDGR